MYIATYIIDIAALIYLIALLYSSTALNANRKTIFNGYNSNYNHNFI